jgi:hypothetical protein
LKQKIKENSGKTKIAKAKKKKKREEKKSSTKNKTLTGMLDNMLLEHIIAHFQRNRLEKRFFKVEDGGVLGDGREHLGNLAVALLHKVERVRHALEKALVLLDLVVRRKVIGVVFRQLQAGVIDVARVDDAHLKVHCAARILANHLHVRLHVQRVLGTHAMYYNSQTSIKVDADQFCASEFARVAALRRETAPQKKRNKEKQIQHNRQQALSLAPSAPPNTQFIIKIYYNLYIRIE